MVDLNFKYLEKKQESLDEQKKQLKKAMPRIEALQNIYPKEEAMLFIGTKGLRSAYAELFRNKTPKDENLWIYVHDKRYAKKSDRFYIQYWDEIAKGIKSKGIADKTYRKSPYIKEFKKKHEFRFVDFPLFSHGEIYKDMFMLVSWSEPFITVLVKSKHVSENFRKYFYDVWKRAKK